ncbi:hypothetical protein MPSEU_000585900 [Mayamaea pseudoterrestris]|nr:hypothetical protein MPSEU_000585900 [Mayamaea pseudoterrestris]
MPKKSKNSVIKSLFRPEQRLFSAPVRHNQHVQNMNRPRKSGESKPKPKKKVQQRKHSAPEKKTAVSHKRDFRLELPKNLPNSNQQVPWLANKVLPVANIVSGSKKTSPSRKAHCHDYLKVPLPCQHKQMDFFELLNRVFSNSVRQALDHEIHALAAYVQLNEREHDARHDWLKQVTRIVQATFSCKDAHLQVYGSFATPGVCSFCSDIDTALWGVVPTSSLEPVAAPARMEQVSMQRKRSATEQDSNAAPLSKQARRDFVKVQPVQSKEKYQKWLEALDAVEPVHDEAGTSERNASSMETAMCVMADGTVFNYDLTGNSSSSSSNSSTGSMSEPKAAIEQSLKTLSQPPVHAVTETDSETSSDLSDIDFADKLANFAESKLDAVNARLPSVRHAPRVCRAIIDSDLDDSDASGGKNHPITLSCSDSENDDDEDGNMHVSYIARSAPTFASRPFSDPGRMSRDTKDACVSALAKLANRLRKAPQARRVDLIKKARVPIIKMVSNLGFEADVAIGGHNGSDTSAYAAAQVDKYKRYE